MSLVRVLAWGIHVPGLAMEDILGGAGTAPACAGDRAEELLGRKGLLGKEAATRLALCAVHRALDLPPGAPRPDGPPDPRVAVVASSNFGNVATVQRLACLLRSGSCRDLSALDAPNASSNVLASTVAIWFRWGGPNLMVCSGATSGLDAVALACVLLRTGRADKVVVVGAEPDDRVAATLHARRRGREPTDDSSLRAAAAAVILALSEDSTKDAVYLGHPRKRIDGVGESSDAPTCVIVGPAGIFGGARHVIDLVRTIGDTYGALGVLQVAVAAHLVTQAPRRSRPSATIICGDRSDGWRSTIVGDSATVRHLEPVREEIHL